MGALRKGVQGNVGPDKSAPLEPSALPGIEGVGVPRRTDVHRNPSGYAEKGGLGTLLGSSQIDHAQWSRVMQPGPWQGSPNRWIHRKLAGETRAPVSFQPKQLP